MAFPVRRVLFLCVANSARSQLAEAIARHELGTDWSFQSAGSAPSRPNPFALEVLESAGISIAGLRSKSVTEIDPESVDLVVTLCAEEECPVFLAEVPRVSWEQPDPDRKHEDLSDEERRSHFQTAFDAIRARVRDLTQGIVDRPPAGDGMGMQLQADGIVRFDYAVGKVVDLEAAETSTAALLRAVERAGWPTPATILIDMQNITTVHREARVHFAQSSEINGMTGRLALLTQNRVSGLVANFFLKVQRPVVPTRMFTDGDEARTWLLA